MARAFLPPTPRAPQAQRSGARRERPSGVRVSSLTPSLFDPGLSPRELSAFRRALVHETNPNHLIGFAGSLAPSFPVSASLLWAKAQLLELRAKKNQEDLAKDGRDAAEHLRALIDRSGLNVAGADTVRWITQPLDVRSNLEHATFEAAGSAWPEAVAMWQKISPPPLLWPRLERMKAAAEAVTTLRSGSLRRPQDEMTRDAAMALLAPLGAASRSGPTLQRLGFHELYPCTRGRTLGERALDFMNAARAARGMSVADALLLRRRSELEDLARRARVSMARLQEAARRAASDLVVDPGALFPDLYPEAVNLARCIVEEVGPGIRILRPSATRLALRGQVSAQSRDYQEHTAERTRWVEWHERAQAAGARA